MSDLIDRLRERAEIIRKANKGEINTNADLLDEAADEIISLRNLLDEAYIQSASNYV